MPRVALQFRMDEETHNRVRAIAARELRSLNAQIEYFVIKGIIAYEKENGPIEQMAEYVFYAAPRSDGDDPHQ